MQEKRHDRVVEMRLCFFLGKVGDYNVSFVETRMCRSTPYAVVELEEPVYAPYVQRGNFPVLVEKIICKGIRPVPNKNM